MEAPTTSTEVSPIVHAVASSRPKRRRVVLLAGLLSGVIVLAGGVVAANAYLSDTYSPQRAVLDYFSAQHRKDVHGMTSNATYLHGDGAYGMYFDESAVIAMMQVAQNAEVSNVKVISVRRMDDAIRLVTVSMTRHGAAQTGTYTVRKDPHRVQWLLYPSWRIEIPAATVTVDLPPQAGRILIDGRVTPEGSGQTAIQVIAGFHNVAMTETNILQATSKDVDALGSASVKLDGKLTEPALKAAGLAVVLGMNSCDAAKYEGCFGHTYGAPDKSHVWFMPVPGYGNVQYNSYVVTQTGDPTKDMTVTVLPEKDKIAVSGTCSSVLTVNGSRRYALKGDYRATLTWNGADFNWDIDWDCQKQKA
jgi:hypothetical protein